MKSENDDHAMRENDAPNSNRGNRTESRGLGKELFMVVGTVELVANQNHRKLDAALLAPLRQDIEMSESLGVCTLQTDFEEMRSTEFGYNTLKACQILLNSVQ